MQHFVLSIIVSWGWRRVLIAFVAGCLSAFAQPPFYFLPVFALTLPTLVWLLDGVGGCSSGRRVGDFLIGRLSRLMAAARIGWCFGFGYYLVSFHWLGVLFVDNPDMSAMTGLVATFLSLFFLALSMAFGTLIACLLWSSSVCRVFALAVGLTAGELIRGRFPINFPGNHFGDALAAFEFSMQAVSLTGSYGMTFLSVLIFASPAVCGLTLRRGAVSVWSMPALSVVFLLLMAGYGFWRVPSDPMPVVDDVRLRLIQPGVPQTYDIWQPEHGAAVIADYWDLSDEATSPLTSGVVDVTHLIWPGLPLSVFRVDGGKAWGSLSDLLSPDVTLLVGFLRRPAVRANDSSLDLHEGLLAFDGDTEILAVYDRVRLTLADSFQLFGFSSEMILSDVTTPFAGTGRASVHLSDVPSFMPLIGQEVSFPGEGVDDGTQPRWILNIVNDTQPGDFMRSYQDLHQARLRAVERGVPLVRVARTGISAIIDPYGRVTTSLPSDVRGVLDGSLPQSLPPTIFSMSGHRILLYLLILGVIFSICAQRVNRSGKHATS